MSHSDSNCSGKVSIIPQFTGPKSSFQRRKLAEQLPDTLTFNNSKHFFNRPLGRKREQNVNVLCRFFHLNDFKTILFTDLADYLFSSFPYFLSLKYVFSVLRTPHHKIICILDGMTRSPDHHSSVISQSRARAYKDKGNVITPPYNLLDKACIHPRGKPRGILQRFLLKNQIDPFSLSQMNKFTNKMRAPK